MLIGAAGVMSIAVIIAAVVAFSVSDETISVANGSELEVETSAEQSALTANAQTGTTLVDSSNTVLGDSPDTEVAESEPASPEAQSVVIAGSPTGEIQPREAFAARNTAYDYVQFQDLPASQVPTSAGENPSINPGGAYGVSFLDNEFGPGGSDAKIETGSAFRTWCSFSHFSYDDPIVFPGQQGAAHLHMFFGNTATDFNSTGQSLINSGGSTCDGGVLNRTGYWVPALLDGNENAVIPQSLFVYYKTFRDRQVTDFPNIQDAEVFPEGLRFLSTAKSTEGQPEQNIDYWCGPVTNNVKHELHSQTIPDCTGVFTQRVRFPFCWDGRLESPDNSHMVFPLGNYNESNCPTSHPRRIPHIEYQIVYSVPGGTSTANWYLSSDVDPVTGDVAAGGTTGHGDWFNGWNPEINRTWNQNCTQALWDCAQNSLDQNKQRLTFHDRTYQGAGPNEYLVPISTLTQLCPGDTDSNTVDIAYCHSAAGDHSSHN